MSKPLRAGGEVDSWCTKCKLVLNHRVIAMVGTAPKRVECSTCGSHHNYRRSAAGEKAAAAVTRSSGASSAAPRSVRAPHVTKAQQALLDRERVWEKGIAGKAVSAFKKYAVSQTFAEGDLVRHAKFGDGIVMRVIDTRKIEVLFKDEPRTLAQAMTD